MNLKNNFVLIITYDFLIIILMKLINSIILIK